MISVFLQSHSLKKYRSNRTRRGLLFAGSGDHEGYAFAGRSASPSRREAACSITRGRAACSTSM